MGTSKARWKTGRRSTWSRRTGAPNSSRTPEVFVPLDSDCLASVARQVNAGLTVALDRGVSTDSLRMAFTRDTIVLGDVRVTSDGDASGRPKGFFLGRSYLPLGDWKAGWRGGVHGAIALEPRTTGRLQPGGRFWARARSRHEDRKSTRLNSSHLVISYAVFCLKKKNKHKPST